MNRVCLTGRLTRNPEIKLFDAAKSNLCTFTLAVDLNKKDTAFILCKSFGDRADLMVKSLTKGSLIAVDGKLDQSTITLQDGTSKVITSVIVDNFDFLEKRKTEEPKSPNTDGLLDLPDEELPFL